MFFGFGMLSNIAFLFLLWLIFKRFIRKKGDSKGGFELDFNGLSEVYFALSLGALGAIAYSIIRLNGNMIGQQLVLLVIFVAAIAIAYSFKRIISLAISLVALPSWWAIQGSSLAIEDNSNTSAVIFVIAAYFAIIFLVGNIHERNPKYSDFSKVYVILGFITATAILFIFSTNSGFSMLEEFSRARSLFGSPEVVMATMLTIFISLALLFYSYSKKFLTGIEAGAIFAYLFAVSCIMAWDQLIWAPAFNLGIFAEVVILIFIGYKQKKVYLINLGSGLLFLLIIVKYFDWFFSFIDKSIFFIGAGTLLLALGYFMEKSRRMLLSKINTTIPEVKPSE